MIEQGKGLSPNTSFVLGIGGVVIIGVVVGLFILLGVILKDTKKPITSPRSIMTTDAVNNPGTAGLDIQLAEITDEDWILGNRDARVSIVEFSDLECPFCKRFHPTMQQVIEEYGDQVNWVYRHFPLSSLHKKAAREAEAAECAGELAGNGGFWAYVDRLFEITPSNDGLLDSQLPQIAQDIGLDRDDFMECLESGRYAQKVQSHVNQAVAAGGQGTPYSVIVVGDEKIPVSGAVPYSQLKAIIDSVL